MNTYYIAGFPVTDELRHHGVLGQEWGKRNGPPYPLSDGAHSVREKKAGWKESLTGKYKKAGFKGLKLTPEQKKMIAAGALIVGGMHLQYRYNAIVSTASTLSDISRLDPVSAIGEISYNYRRSAKGNEDVPPGSRLAHAMKQREQTGSLDKRTGLYKNENTESIEDNCRKVNPDYNPNNRDTSENCGLCAITYDMRRRGYDVYAGQSHTGISRADNLAFYNGGHLVKRAGDRVSSTISGEAGLSKDVAQKIMNSFKNEKNTRGLMTIGWSYSRGGHALAYEVDSSGLLTIVDAQTNNIYKGNSAMQLFMQSSSVETMRTDNLRPDIRAMKKANIIK